MLDDFQMISFHFDKPILVYPIADVHYGSIKHDRAKWTAFVRSIAEKEDAYLIMNGDLINNNVRSSKGGSPFDDTLRPREQKKEMTEFLEPIKHKVLCMTSGNHERRSQKDADDDVTYDIACKLGIEDLYRPNAVFMKIGIGNQNKGGGRVGNNGAYCFAVTHGSGGGIYTGGSVNKNERWGNAIDNIDCVIVGHTHKATVTRPSKIVVDPRNNRVTIKDYLVISCSSWQTYGDYALQKMLLPASTCRPQILRLNDSREKDIEVIW